MKTINLTTIEEKLLEFGRERNWQQYHSVKNLTMALSVETSELLEIFQWMTEAESDLVGHDVKKMQKVKDEIADIASYMFLITAKLNIDLEQAIKEKILKNDAKYPVEQVLGSSKKYDEY